MKKYRLHSNPTDVHFESDIRTMVLKARSEFQIGDGSVWFEDDHGEGFAMAEALRDLRDDPKGEGLQLAISSLRGSYCAPIWESKLYAVVNSLKQELILR
jgi:hypothetical protein